MTAVVAAFLSLVLAPHGRDLHAQGITAVSQFAWFDRTGKRLGTFGELADYLGMELSHDGKRLAVPVLDPALGTHDIWVFDVATGRRTKLTSDPGDENFLIWSPDDRRVVFNSTRNRGGRSLDLFETTSSGGGTEEVLLADNVAKWPVSWSPDGRNILYVTSPGTGNTPNNDIWVLPLFGDRKPYPLLATPATENWPAFSPDGKWIAYSMVDEAGRQELYVMQFPPTGLKWQISSGGGFQARWRRDGKEILYLTPDSKLVAAAVSGSGSTFEVSARQVLFETRFAYAQYHAYDLAADGQRILVNTAVLMPSGRPATSARLLTDRPFQLTSLIPRSN
ncbi:MAG: hypothetical protein WBD07_09605 [Vicinamibacterales bacterium]